MSSEMFPWPPPAHQPPHDEIRSWAELEGKSATMRDDLYRRHLRRRRHLSAVSIFVLVELAVWIVEVWRYLSQ
ncbi:MAG: hypothetical protein WD669_00680 [Pirellulales bacterium]